MTSQSGIHDPPRPEAASQPLATYPPWVTLERFCTVEVQGSSSTSVGDPNTLAAARTTTGLVVSVSLSLAAPPEGSRVCVQLPSGVHASYAVVLAAHGDSVLILAAGIRYKTSEHFVYNAGDAAADPPRPPSLSLLPQYGLLKEKGNRRTYLDSESTGILFRNVCVTAGGSAIKYVNIYPRCCCGGAGDANCRRSRQACTVRTWTLRMGDMEWVMDGMIDATQLWAPDGYKGVVPRVQPDCPVVSMEEPHVVSFEVCEEHHIDRGDKTVWMVMVDIRSKSLRSVFRYPEWRRYIDRQLVRPSRVSEYFSPEQARTMAPSMTSKSGLGINEKQTKSNTDESAQPSCKSSDAPTQASKAAPSPEAMILASLQEIPGLARDDMLKSYRILSHDDSGRRFRCLMALPLDLRMDYLLMEIKASEVCCICSACFADLQS